MHVLKTYAYLDVDRHHYVEIDGWMDDGRWTKGWRDGWMDGWMDAWMAQSMQILPTHPDLRHEPGIHSLRSSMMAAMAYCSPQPFVLSAELGFMLQAQGSEDRSL